MPVAAVFGSARVEPGHAEYDRAVTTGRLLAESGWTVMTGGYRGVMEGASSGARAADGHVIGVTVASWIHQTANEWVVEERVAPDLVARLGVLVAADALIAVGGGIGTLAEVALSWNMRQRGATGAPLILVGQNWTRVVAALSRELLLSEDDLAHVQVVDDPATAVRVAVSAHVGP